MVTGLNNFYNPGIKIVKYDNLLARIVALEFNYRLINQDFLANVSLSLHLLESVRRVEVYWHGVFDLVICSVTPNDAKIILLKMGLPS